MAIPKTFACFLGFGQHSDEKSRKRNFHGDDSFSGNLNSRVGTSAVRLIHPGGCEEWLQNEIFARNIMENYPGMCVARPEVFKNPNKSVLLGEEKLLFGNKYYLVPSTTVKKLKRRHEKKSDLLMEKKSFGDLSEGCSDESFCSAKDFYVNRKEQWGKCDIKKTKDRNGKRGFMPPIRKLIIRSEFVWEPSLDSIQEISS